MRFKLFPLAVQVGDVVHAPAMMVAYDDVTQIWVLVDGTPTVVASGGAVVTRDRVDRGTRLVNGKRAQWVAQLDGGMSWPVGASPECCGCHRHPLCQFVPPDQPVVFEPAVAVVPV